MVPGSVRVSSPVVGGDPEVRDVDAPVPVEQQVRRLHVSVDDALRMRSVECLSRLGEPGERLRRGDPPLAETVVDRAALEVLHDDVRLPAVLADVEDGDHVRCSREPRGGERLPPEARVTSSSRAYRSESSLTATCRWRTESVARYTSPMPPRAISEAEVYRFGSAWLAVAIL